jgi:hypothetical protein
MIHGHLNPSIISTTLTDVTVRDLRAQLRDDETDQLFLPLEGDPIGLMSRPGEQQERQPASSQRQQQRRSRARQREATSRSFALPLRHICLRPSDLI